MRATLLALVLASIVPSTALADDPASGEQPVIVVHGCRQAPSVVPILSRARFRYRAPELEHRATDAISETVTHSPF